MADARIPLTLVDWLDDLCVRFLVNLPQSELSSVPRLCFQVEEAQWFYEDFVRPAVQASGAQPLPHLPLRQFVLLMFQHCPLLSGFTDAQHLAAYEDFLSYKVRVPVRGAILLDHSMEKLVLVRGWKKGASWSFPRGKINKDERDLDCAIREVYEETGFNLSTSGLIPEHESDIKYIDVTMREQHMRLFVFRGVPEDTYFETQTRKEISKIQWYWIKDLPGFKKQNKQQPQHQSEAEVLHANKFYMVAPFLGHLKKWIGQQRKKDIVEAQRQASALHGPGFPVIEDESEDQQPQEIPNISVGQREDELKRLLSVGTVPTAAPNSMQPDVQAGNLLAMLQGGPRHMNGEGQSQQPFAQMNAFSSQQGNPQLQHVRQSSMVQQQNSFQAPPSGSYSPQRMHYEQHTGISQPNPGMFGPSPVPQGYPPNMPPGMLPPHLQQQQFQQRPLMQFSPQYEQQNPMDFPGPARAPMPPQAPVSQLFQTAPASNAFMAQGPQGTIASGPSAPKASQLPAPNLNQHTMNLLNALKGGNNLPTAAPLAAAKASSGKPGAHQAALLDLFKKPAASSPPAEQPTLAPAQADPPSPAPTDATERPRKPSKGQERKATLNEITRTLPSRLKAKATPTPEPPVVQDRSSDARPKSRQLFNPNEPEKSKGKSPIPSAPHSPVRILQRPSSSANSSSPSMKPQASPSPSSAQDSSSKPNGHRQRSSFTILTRPGSSRGPGLQAPPTPLKNETPTPNPPFQPQLLKRHQPSAAQDEETQMSGSDTKDQLLRLFSKTSATSSHSAMPTPQPSVEPLEKKEPAPPTDTKAALLGLFKVKPPPEQPSPTALSPVAVIPTAVPPPTPRIQPTISSSISTPVQNATATPAPAASKQQTLLLNLFNKPKTTSPSTSATATPVAAPLGNTNGDASPILATPISPFALGTPITTHGSSATASIAGTLAGANASAGMTNASAQSRSQSPSQGGNRDFLMGYLNGVVRGAGK